MPRLLRVRLSPKSKVQPASALFSGTVSLTLAPTLFVGKLECVPSHAGLHHF